MLYSSSAYIISLHCQLTLPAHIVSLPSSSSKPAIHAVPHRVWMLTSLCLSSSGVGADAVA